MTKLYAKRVRDSWGKLQYTVTYIGKQYGLPYINRELNDYDCLSGERKPKF